jgi:hypothetical protein
MNARFARLLVGLIFVAAVLAAAPIAKAADFRGGDRVVIGPNQVINDDLYVAASEIQIDGTVKGDVYAFGQTVTINGTVEHDVIAAASTIVLNGTVGDTARVGGQTIIFGDNAKITRSALVGGFALETKSNSIVGSDLLIGAYQALLAGTVQRDVIAGSYGIQLNGIVGRNVRVSVADSNAGPSPAFYMPPASVPVPFVPAGLTIVPSAKIGGDLVYESQQPISVPQGATVSGPVVHQTPVPSERRELTLAEQQALQTQQATEWWLNQLRRFVVLLVLGLVALWLLPKWIAVLADFIQTRPVGSLGRGALLLLAIVLAPMVIALVVILLAIVFGLLTLGDLAGLAISAGIVMVGVLLFLFFIFTAYAAPVVVSYLGGRMILERVQAEWAKNRFVALVVGLILLTLLALIPIVNVIVGIVVSLLALGALVLWVAPRLARPAATQQKSLGVQPAALGAS